MRLQSDFCGLMWLGYSASNYQSLGACKDTQIACAARRPAPRPQGILYTAQPLASTAASHLKSGQPAALSQFRHHLRHKKGRLTA